MGIDNINYLLERYNKKVVNTHLREDTRNEIEKYKNSNHILGLEFNI